ncbi:DUF1629 domain-containing protein [Xanthomonas prunicola]|nr:DUF1629 domain-containing protein [Xanthomonas prunicola]UXA55172.1 DUF1629 domain-containing protein [Xanthomonas prunicola]
MRRGGPGHGAVFENRKILMTPPRLILRPAEGGFPPMREVPRIVYDPKRGPPPEDLEGGMSGYWLVSARLKKVFEAVDPKGFEFVECDYRLEDGSKGPSHFLCDVVRNLDALDEESSRLNIKISDDYPEGKFYNFAGGISLSFRKEIVNGAHVFRMPYSGRYVICDRILRDAIYDAGIGSESGSDGIWLEDASDY